MPFMSSVPPLFTVTSDEVCQARTNGRSRSAPPLTVTVPANVLCRVEAHRAGAGLGQAAVDDRHVTASDRHRPTAVADVIVRSPPPRSKIRMRRSWPCGLIVAVALFSGLIVTSPVTAIFVFAFGHQD